MPPSSAGLIYGPGTHHLDHLAPLCAILGIPLIVTEELLLKQVREVYPFVDALYVDCLELPFFLIKNYRFVFSCFSRIVLNELLFLAELLSKKKIHPIWCPHGNSDKGNIKPYAEALCQENLLLVYGQQMIDFFNRHKLRKPYVITGNFRYQFYMQHKAWYDAYVAKKISLKQKKNILYAPTWQDYEKSSSFFSVIDFLIEQKPAKYTLLIKPHPNLRLQNLFLVEELEEKCKNLPGVYFISDPIPIYPLLNHCDLYIGDRSSIGYDFLHVNRPMFFLNQNDLKEPLSTYLFRCGLAISPQNYSHIYSLIDQTQQELTPIREKVYQYAFASCSCLKELKKTIFHALDEIKDHQI
ncbi:CDP-glycerol glycerophosphotransferase family protein [Candidatus Rhabdochlamydia sp. T3358]|uniref:CDP-glycerol glycerophosphotransferase family protein n=1 Tax=Candidatus Rhabdochlamydia sp. T3358 TaxID=2099795 RepID=UPI0010B16A7F|nr:CDP-glycerol glycerophosphotransferase family protein [Candidatus Rhabdochlamydia sp. T3358]VHN99593.1 Putative CDP-glycerol:glycerophosphate glycerophosphotransferase [Candidatus Rhabdochlamydia sp. T3358]